MRVYSPANRTGAVPGLLYIHGGGFVLGDLDMFHASLLRLVDELGVVIVSVDYRLAPEHPFPAPVEDCYAALQWVEAKAAELGIDPARLGVGGESAGGGLPAAVALLARDRGGPALCFQYLGIPELDDRLGTPSMRAYTDTPLWNRPNAVFSWTSYLGAEPGGDGVSPYAAPARAEDLAGLPPAFVTTCQFDPLRDEGIDVRATPRARRRGDRAAALPGHVPRLGHGGDGGDLAPDVRRRGRGAAPRPAGVARAEHGSGRVAGTAEFSGPLAHPAPSRDHECSRERSHRDHAVGLLHPGAMGAAVGARARRPRRPGVLASRPGAGPRRAAVPKTRGSPRPGRPRRVRRRAQRLPARRRARRRPCRRRLRLRRPLPRRQRDQSPPRRGDRADPGRTRPSRTAGSSARRRGQPARRGSTSPGPSRRGAAGEPVRRHAPAPGRAGRPGGQASALKLAFAAYNKLTYALAAQSHALAQHHGVGGELRELAADVLPGDPAAARRTGSPPPGGGPGGGRARWPRSRKPAPTPGCPRRCSTPRGELFGRWREHRDDDGVALGDLLQALVTPPG